MENINEFILKNLSDAVTKEHRIEDNKILLLDSDVKISFEVYSIEEKSENTYMSVIDYFIESSLFDETIINTSSGVGSTIEESILENVVNFRLTAICALEDFIDNKLYSSIRSNFNNSYEEYNIYSGCGIDINISDNTNLLDLISDQLPNYIGNRNTYSIKTYCAKMNDYSIGEVMINNVIVHDLSQILKDFISKKEFTGFVSKKNAYILSKTKKLEYTNKLEKSYIEKLIENTLKILNDNLTTLGTDEINEKIYKIINNDSLYFEIINFLPEMCVEIHFSDITTSDKVVFYYSEEKQIEVSKTQLSNYYIIFDKLLEIYNEQIIDFDVFKYLISISATYSSLSQLLAENPEIDMSLLRFTPIVYSTNEDYTPN